MEFRLSTVSPFPKTSKSQGLFLCPKTYLVKFNILEGNRRGFAEEVGNYRFTSPTLALGMPARPEEKLVASGTGGISPGAGLPLSTEWLQAQKKLLKQARLEDATETKLPDSSEFSKDAQKLSTTKDERMLTKMKAELSQLDPESESFLQEATERLIDSVIDQEYGEYFKKKPGYAGLQEKLTQTVLENPVSREALSEFFDLLLLTESVEESSHEDEPSSPDDEEEEGQRRPPPDDPDGDSEEQIEEES